MASFECGGVVREDGDLTSLAAEEGEEVAPTQGFRGRTAALTGALLMLGAAGVAVAVFTHRTEGATATLTKVKAEDTQELFGAFFSGCGYCNCGWANDQSCQAPNQQCCWSNCCGMLLNPGMGTNDASGTYDSSVTSQASDDFHVGERVQVHGRNGETWTATIVAPDGNGIFEVRYDNGSMERVSHVYMTEFTWTNWFFLWGWWVVLLVLLGLGAVGAAVSYRQRRKQAQAMHDAIMLLETEKSNKGSSYFPWA